MKILICTSRIGAESWDSHQSYSQKHSYDYRIYKVTCEGGSDTYNCIHPATKLRRHHSWSKVLVMYDACSQDYDYVLYIDSSIEITDKFLIQSIIDQAPSSNVIFFQNVPKSSLMLLQVNSKTRQYLSSWYKYCAPEGNTLLGYEERVLNMLSYAWNSATVIFPVKVNRQDWWSDYNPAFPLPYTYLDASNPVFPKNLYFVSAMVICSLNKSISCLEEFLVYYKNLGVEHLYLYNNDTLTTDETRKVFQEIVKEWRPFITYIEWNEYVPEFGVLTNQDLVKHNTTFLNGFGDESTWTLLLEIDRFMFSPRNLDLHSYLQNQPDDVTQIDLQPKFFLKKDSNITNTYRCIGNINTANCWVKTQIVKPNSTGRTITEDPKRFRVNCYSDSEENLLKVCTDLQLPIRCNQFDYTMSRYSHLFIDKELRKKKVIVLGDIKLLDSIFYPLVDSLEKVYEFVFYNPYNFMYDPLKTDMLSADILLISNSVKDLTSWDGFECMIGRTIVMYGEHEQFDDTSEKRVRVSEVVDWKSILDST